MKRALLLVNAGSRQGKEKKDAIAPALTAAGLDLIVPSESNPAHFAEIIERFKDKVDLVVVGGGDGTCLCAAQAVMKTSLPLGIIPLGTANNLARSLEIPLAIEGAAKIIGEGATREVDVATVNGKPFLNVSGMGLSTRVNRLVPGDLKKRWGLFAYVFYFFSLLKRSRSFLATVELDGETHRFRSRQIHVCNGKYYGSGLSIAQEATISDGKLHLVSTHFVRTWQMILLLPLYLLKRHNPQRGLHTFSAERLTISTNPPVALDTDGEITTQTPAQYEILTRALRVFAPTAAT